MDKIRFKNFVPKDDDLRPFWQEGVSVIDVYRKIEKELNDQIASAKPIEVHKNPPQPTWDLKRDLALRNKRLDQLTLRAIAKLNCSSSEDPVVMVTEPPENDSEQLYISAEAQATAHKLSFLPEELSDDEDFGGLGTDAARVMGFLTKNDAANQDEHDAD